MVKDRKVEKSGQTGRQQLRMAPNSLDRMHLGTVWQVISPKISIKELPQKRRTGAASGPCGCD